MLRILGRLALWVLLVLGLGTLGTWVYLEVNKRATLQAAEQGNASAQFNLGVRYANGRGVPEDVIEAAKWYRLAAEQDHPKAQFNLGAMYARGWGVLQDAAEATKWYRKAAEQGHAEAQWRLGLYYTRRFGGKYDPVQAYAWFSIAAAQGHTRAAENRDEIKSKLRRTPEERGRGESLAREYWEAYVLPFRK